MYALEHDRLGQEILQALWNSTKLHKIIPLRECQYKNGLLLINKFVYMPDLLDLYLQILKNYYDHLAAEHLGHAVTCELVSQDY